MLKKILKKVSDSVRGRSDTSAPKSAPKKVEPKSKAIPAQPKEVWVPGDGKKTERSSRRSSSSPRSGKPSRGGEGTTSSESRRSSAPRKDRAEQTGGESAGDRPRRRRRRRRSGERKPDQATQSDTNASAPPPKQGGRPPQRELGASVHKPKNINAFEGQSEFASMDIVDEVKKALDEMHFKVTTPIQAQLLPIALAGRDAAGKAQTGTGKTAAFLISIFTHFLRNPLAEKPRDGMPRALILAPTRELALQIRKDAEDIGRYCNLHTVAVYGGMDFDKQQRALETTVDIIVATPGRLIDFIQRKVIDLSNVEVLVIDEADRMLDMGFIPDVRRIVRQTPHPEKRQTLMFSATLTPEIVRMAEQWTRNAETIEIEPEQVAADTVNQRVIITTQEEKFTLLVNLLKQENPERVIVFSNRRDQAEMLNDHLKSYGFSTDLLSGAVDQKKRMRVLDDFKAGQIQVLVATDVAGRGLHVEGISHVINYHMPMDPDDYVHRIGRTGRAGEIGTSISFACELDSFAIPDIETFIGHPLTCEHPDDALLAPLPAPDYQVKPRERKRTGGGGRGPRRGGGGGGGSRGGRRGPPRRR